MSVPRVDVEDARGAVEDASVMRGTGMDTGAMHDADWGAGAVRGMVKIFEVPATEEG
jgi:hypothetical protein